jgi:hypothetical protein
MNFKKTLLILTIATTMCACKDNATTEPEPTETNMFDTTFIGDTMKITYKDWVPLDWSEFNSDWAADAALRNTKFDRVDVDCINYNNDYSYTIDVIKNDSAIIKKIFNDLWEKYKKATWNGYIKDSNNVWKQDYQIGDPISIALTGSHNVYPSNYFVGVLSGYIDESSEGYRTILDRRVRIHRP